MSPVISEYIPERRSSPYFPPAPASVQLSWCPLCFRPQPWTILLNSMDMLANPFALKYIKAKKNRFPVQNVSPAS
jgi:hypothetical protein